PRERRQRDADDGDVEDGHDRSEDDHARDDEHGAVDRVGVFGAGLPGRRGGLSSHWCSFVRPSWREGNGKSYPGRASIGALGEAVTSVTAVLSIVRKGTRTRRILGCPYAKISAMSPSSPTSTMARPLSSTP